ncbi:unnamed protein product [Rangifer tarandus platyrhynchus]|uniref:Uncharacterized protein n=2 Tax=Rangifer tarandus platyrhynchus TaxID=3082113 RepID=A0ABN8YC30_RANTA|nr:unnamed protein product [Rangifer tarandus platyrhynchus]
MNRSTPGLPVHHKLPEFTQTHVHRVSDAIRPSHPLSSPSPPAPNPSQHQGSTTSGYSSVQFSSVTQSCLTLCNPMDSRTPGLPVHCLLPQLTQTHVHESMMPSNHFILCCPLLLLPPIPPSIRVFSSELVLCIR